LIFPKFLFLSWFIEKDGIFEILIGKVSCDAAVADVPIVLTSQLLLAFYNVPAASAVAAD
jgi:hypothetical protein